MPFWVVLLEVEMRDVECDGRKWGGQEDVPILRVETPHVRYVRADKVELGALSCEPVEAQVEIDGPFVHVPAAEIELVELVDDEEVDVVEVLAGERAFLGEDVHRRPSIIEALLGGVGDDVVGLDASSFIAFSRSSHQSKHWLRLQTFLAGSLTDASPSASASFIRSSASERSRRWTATRWRWISKPSAGSA